MKKMKLFLSALAITYCIVGCKEERLFDEPGYLVPKTADQDPSVPSITVNGAVLHAEAFGPEDSAMIVVLHGGPGSDYRYLTNCEAFADAGYRVVFYDQRGSGLSQRFEKDAYSLQVMYDDLTAVIEHYRTSASQKIFLLGHSWGAMLATAYIQKYPETISGVILAEPGGLVWQDVMDYVTRSRQAVVTSELLNDITYTDQFITGCDHCNDEQAVLDYKFALLSAYDYSSTGENPTGNIGPLLFWRSGAVINEALFELGENEEPDWSDLSAYTTHVLFVYSEYNEAYGAEYAQHVSSAYPDVELFEVMGQGHDMLSFPGGWSQFYPKALSYFNSLKY